MNGRDATPFNSELRGTYTKEGDEIMQTVLMIDDSIDACDLVEFLLAGEGMILVQAMTAGLPRLLASLLSAGLAPADVCRTLAVQSDTATTRLIELSFRRRGPAPVALAWMALGSVARREAPLRELAPLIASNGGTAEVAVADVGHREQVEAALASIR